MPPKKPEAKPAVAAAKKVKLPEPNDDGHVELRTAAPRPGPLGDEARATLTTEADVIAAAAKDHEPGDNPNFPPERPSPYEDA